VKVDYRTVWAFVHAEGLSFKKSVLPSEQPRSCHAMRAVTCHVIAFPLSCRTVPIVQRRRNRGGGRPAPVSHRWAVFDLPNLRAQRLDCERGPNDADRRRAQFHGFIM
jgi:hypothetical protein